MNFQYTKFKEFNPIQIRAIKLLHQKIFGETIKFHVLCPDDLIFTLSDSNKKSNKFIGMGIIKYYSPERHFKSENTTTQVPYLIDFGILPKYRKKGIGSIFLQHITDTMKIVCPNAEFVNLDVKSNDIKAIEFYKKNNFQEVGYYKPPTERLKELENAKNIIEYKSMSYSI